MPSSVDIIEALLFASDKPLPIEKIAQIADVKADEALEELGVLQEEKARIGGLRVVEVAGGWQLVTKPHLSSFVAQLRDVPRQKLSRAAFEVLAIVAYRQPVTRGEIESLRGVDCGGPLQLLLEKKLLDYAGRRETIGRPWLYATTPLFLEHFGLRTTEDLPSLTEFAALNSGAEPTLQGLFAPPGEAAAAMNAATNTPSNTANHADQTDEEK